MRHYCVSMIQILNFIIKIIISIKLVILLLVIFILKCISELLFEVIDVSMPADTT